MSGLTFRTNSSKEHADDQKSEGSAPMYGLQLKNKSTNYLQHRTSSSSNSEDSIRTASSSPTSPDDPIERIIMGEELFECPSTPTSCSSPSEDILTEEKLQKELDDSLFYFKIRLFRNHDETGANAHRLLHMQQWNVKSSGSDEWLYEPIWGPIDQRISKRLPLHMHPQELLVEPTHRYHAPSLPARRSPPLHVQPQSSPQRYKNGKMMHLPCCSFCHGKVAELYIARGEKPPSKDEFGEYSTHPCMENGIVKCPVLRKVECSICGATGDKAHTTKYHLEHVL